MRPRPPSPLPCQISSPDEDGVGSLPVVSVYAPRAAMAPALALIRATIDEHRLLSGSPLSPVTSLRAPDLAIGSRVVVAVSKVLDYGVLLSIGDEEVGFMHVSEFSPKRTSKPTDLLSEGDELTVMVVDMDARGRGRFSLRTMLKDGEQPSKFIHRRSGPSPDSAVDLAKTDAVTEAQASNATAIPQLAASNPSPPALALESASPAAAASDVRAASASPVAAASDVRAASASPAAAASDVQAASGTPDAGHRGAIAAAPHWKTVVDRLFPVVADSPATVAALSKRGASIASPPPAMSSDPQTTPVAPSTKGSPVVKRPAETATVRVAPAPMTDVPPATPEIPGRLETLQRLRAGRAGRADVATSDLAPSEVTPRSETTPLAAEHSFGTRQDDDELAPSAFAFLLPGLKQVSEMSSLRGAMPLPLTSNSLPWLLSLGLKEGSEGCVVPATEPLGWRSAIAASEATASHQKQERSMRGPFIQPRPASEVRGRDGRGAHGGSAPRDALPKFERSSNLNRHHGSDGAAGSSQGSRGSSRSRSGGGIGWKGHGDADLQSSSFDRPARLHPGGGRPDSSSAAASTSTRAADGPPDAGSRLQRRQLLQQFSSSARSALDGAAEAVRTMLA